MEQINPRRIDQAIKEGQFLETLKVEDHLDTVKNMRNMLNLKEFAKELAPTSCISLGGGIGVELFVLNASKNHLVEFNQKLITKAKNHAKKHQIHLEPLFYDLINLPLPFENKSFDLVIMNAVIEHIPNIFGLIQEAKRIGKNFFIGSIPTGDPPVDHLHVWKWHGLKDVLDFATSFGGTILSSYWCHFDIVWREEWEKVE